MKSHVSMAVYECIQCGAYTPAESLLLDTRLRESLDHETVVGPNLCTEHREDGYIALAEVENEEYTGNVLHIRESAFPELLNTPIPDSGLLYCHPDVIKELQKCFPTEIEPIAPPPAPTDSVTDT